MNTIQISPFPTKELIFVSGLCEQVIIGGRDKFPIVENALVGIKKVGVIGWGSQGPAQAQNFRDTLKEINSHILVTVGLREGSSSIPAANAAGFNKEEGSLGEMYKVISESDLVILLISDGSQTENYKEIFAHMKDGATLGLSHGFLEGYLTGIGEAFPDNINVVMVAPKGMGPSVRRLYLQGLEEGGSGINSSIAVHQDVGNAYSIAVGWAVAIGSPVVFNTTIPQEWRSDLFGERAILLGGLWGMVEALHENFCDVSEPDVAFENSVLALTTFISPEISKLGLVGFYEKYIQGGYEFAFNRGYSYSYGPFEDVMNKIYDNVDSGQEIKDVVEATGLLDDFPMESVETNEMWEIGKKVSAEVGSVTEISEYVAMTAGAFIAGVMAQFRLLRSKGHCVSEIVNESLIEATDSLVPYMEAKGVSYMVDNCSTTARLGTRRYGPMFYKELQTSFYLGSKEPFDDDWMSDPIHTDIEACYEYKPSVAIAVAT